MVDRGSRPRLDVRNALERLNWDDLRLFLTVARYSSLDQSAHQLRLDPTTLGRRIRRLERSLDVSLLERSRKGHRLTPTGEAMLAQLEEVEHQVLDLVESISGEAKRVQGVVRLSVTEAFGNVLIAPALGALFARHPDLKIELVASTGLLSVSKREADMAVLLSRPSRGRLKVQKLTDYSLQLYATRTYLNKFPKIHTPEDLRQHTLIGYVDDLIYSPRLRYFDEVAPGLSPALTSSSLLAQKQLATADCGIAVLPKFVGDQEPRLRLVLPKEVHITRSFYLAVHEDLFDHARIQVVVEFLQALIANADL